MASLLGLVLLVLLLALQYQVLVHLMLSAEVPEGDKKAWILGLVLAGGIVAVIYYFKFRLWEKSSDES